MNETARQALEHAAVNADRNAEHWAEVAERDARNAAIARAAQEKAQAQAADLRAALVAGQ